MMMMSLAGLSLLEPQVRKTTNQGDPKLSIIFLLLIPAAMHQIIALLGSLSSCLCCLASSPPPLNCIHATTTAPNAPTTTMGKTVTNVCIPDFPQFSHQNFILFHFLLFLALPSSGTAISISYVWSCSLSFTNSCGLLACITWPVCMRIFHHILLFGLFRSGGYATWLF